MDQKERKRMRWGRKRMERKERGNRRRVAAVRDRQWQHMEQLKKERTDEWMEPNERRRSTGACEERPPLLLPLLCSSPRENACASACACVCVFFLLRSAKLSFTHKDGTYLALAAVKELAEYCAFVFEWVSVRKKHKETWLTCLAENGAWQPEMPHLTLTEVNTYTLNPLKEALSYTLH